MRRVGRVLALLTCIALAAALGIVLLAAFSPYLIAQNVENQPIASQYGSWRVQGYAPSTYTGFSPTSCRVQGGASFFNAFTVGVPITIVDGNPSLTETVTPSAVTITNVTCGITISPVHQHNMPWYLTSATGGLQEALNTNLTSTSVNVILLDTNFYTLVGGSHVASVIASVHGTTRIGLADITQTPYVWYSWNGSQYVPISLSAVVVGHGAPSNPCAAPGDQYLDEDANRYYVCPAASGNWVLVSGSTPTGNQLQVLGVPNAGGTGVPVSSLSLTTKFLPTVNTSVGTLLPTIAAALPDWEIPNDNGSTHDWVDAGVGSVPGSATPAQITAQLAPTGGAYFITARNQHTPFTPSGQFPSAIIDERTDIPANAVSVKTIGAQCDVGQRGTPSWGTATTTMGSNSVTVNSWGSSSFLFPGQSLAIVGTVGGVPTAWEPIVTAWSGSTITTFDNAPFSVSSADFTYGFDDTTPIQNFIYDAIGFPVTATFTGSTPLIPGGSCFVHTLIFSHSLAMYGISKDNSALVGFPGEDVIAANDPSNPDPVIGYQPGGIGDLHNLHLVVDNRIDARKAWTQIVTRPSSSCEPGNFTGCSTTTINHSALQRHFDRTTVHSNNPVGPGWCTGVNQIDGNLCTNGVASVTNGVDTITVAGGETAPSAGEIVVFPYLTPAFKATVSSVAGQVVTLSATYPGATSAQQEWFAGTAFQTLNANITSSSTSLAGALSIAPSPLNPNNVGSRGLVQVDSEQIGYYLTTISGNVFRNLTRGMNGTTAASHTSGALIVPLNPITPASPWPVRPTVNSGTTPANAEFYPADAVGNCAVCEPLTNGSSAYTPPNHTHWTDLDLTSLTGTDTTNGTVGIFTVQIPYFRTESNIQIQATEYGVIQAEPLNNHQFNAQEPDCGGTHKNFYIPSSVHSAVLECGGQSYYGNWDAYNSTGTGIELVSEPDDEQVTEQGVAVGVANFDNMFYEQNSHDPTQVEPQQQECFQCTARNMHLDQNGSIYFIGENNTFDTGNIGSGSATYPIILYGSDSRWYNFFNTGYSQQNSNVYGQASVLNYGGDNTFVGASANGGPLFSMGGPGTRSVDSNVQNGDYLLTGNLATPYLNANSGMIYPEEFDTPGFNANAFTTVIQDPTATFGQALLCPGGHAECNSVQFDPTAGVTSGFKIAANSRITPQAYTVYAPYRVDAGTPTMSIKFFVANATTFVPIATLATASVTGATSWQTAELDNVNLTSYAGDVIGIQIDTFSDASKRYYLGGLMLAPIAQKIITNNLTVNGTCTGCGSGGFITSLTTTGSTGAAAVAGGVLNIPIYSGGGSGCTSDCIITDPSGSQSILQPAASTFAVGDSSSNGITFTGSATVPELYMQFSTDGTCNNLTSHCMFADYNVGSLLGGPGLDLTIYPQTSSFPYLGGAQYSFDYDGYELSAAEGYLYANDIFVQAAESGWTDGGVQFDANMYWSSDQNSGANPSCTGSVPSATTFFLCEATDNAVLPAVAANTTMSPSYLPQITFEKWDSSGTVTITPAGGDTIAGASSYTLTTQYQTVTLTGDGHHTWYIANRSNAITALTGDITATGPGSVAATLATVNGSPGSCGDATHVCAVTTNGKGLVTAQSATAITANTVSSSLTTNSLSKATGAHTVGDSLFKDDGTTGSYTGTGGFQVGIGTAPTILGGSGVPTGCGSTYQNGSLYLNLTGTTGSILYACIGSTWTDVK